MTHLQKIRSDFPILSRLTPQGKPLVYLDNAASTQKPIPVLEAMDNFYRGNYANVHRGSYWPASSASSAYESSRKKIAEFLNAPSERSIVFTGGTTDSVNKVASALTSHLDGTSEILISEMEHHSNFVPWQILAERTNSMLKFIEIDENGEWNLQKTAADINPNTRVIAATTISNTLGTINKVESLLMSVPAKNRISLIDAAQSVAQAPVDVSDLGCSFLTFSAHKMYGPMGLGVLYGQINVLEELPPLAFGGGMIKEVQKSGTLFRDPPHKHEAGTPNVAGVIGLAAAIDYLKEIGWNFITEHNQELTYYTLERLKEVDNLVVYGSAAERAPIISFNIIGIHPHDVASFLAEEGIAIRAGHHCTQPLMDALGIQGTCRISLAIYNTKEEIDKFVFFLEKAEKFFL